MPRARYLKPEFFKDEDLAEHPFEVRLFFEGLWNFADKAGRLEDRPSRLKAEIFPYDKVDAEKCLEALSKLKNGSKRPFIHRYEVKGERFIQILNWDKHQKPHHQEVESRIPPYNPSTITSTITIKEHLPSEMKNYRLNTEVTPTNTKPKTKHIDFVLLTDEELKKLVGRFGGAETEKRIERLNNYLGSTGKKYRSHYHTILSWASREPITMKKEEYSETLQKALDEVKRGTTARKPV